MYPECNIEVSLTVEKKSWYFNRYAVALSGYTVDWKNVGFFPFKSFVSLLNLGYFPKLQIPHVLANLKFHFVMSCPVKSNRFCLLNLHFLVAGKAAMEMATVLVHLKWS